MDKMSFDYHNERTITKREEYIRELEYVFRHGYAMDREEELTGVMCIGAPILNHVGYPLGAIWTSAPKDRVLKQSVEYYVERIKGIAESISKDIGYNTMRSI